MKLDDEPRHPETDYPESSMDIQEQRPRKSFRDLLRDGDFDNQQKKPRNEEEEPASDDDELPQKEDEKDCPTITLTKKEKERLRKPWRRTLIIKLWGRSVGYNYLLRRLQAIWRPKAQMNLIGLDNGYFLVKFEEEEDYKYAKFEGPWMILEHYLIVKELSHDFDPITDTTENILVRVRFPCFPIEYYANDFLMRLGSNIGKPIRVDDATSMASRGLFARMCIEIHISKPLLARFKLRKRIRKIEYEGLHLICFRCGVYGYHYGNCKVEGEKEEETQKMEQEAKEVNHEHSAQKEGESIPRAGEELRITPEENENYGPWMIAPKRMRRGIRGRGRRTNQNNATRLKERNDKKSPCKVAQGLQR